MIVDLDAVTEETRAGRMNARRGSAANVPSCDHCGATTVELQDGRCSLGTPASCAFGVVQTGSGAAARGAWPS